MATPSKAHPSQAALHPSVRRRRAVTAPKLAGGGAHEHGLRASPTAVTQGVRQALLLMALAAGAGWLPGAVPLAMAADVAPGGADSAVKSYAVPAGPLGEALASFAASAGVTVQLDARLVEGRRTQGLSGNYGVREGFARLLSGSGLEAVERSPGTWVLHQAASPAPSATPVTKGQTEQVLPVVTVKAV